MPKSSRKASDASPCSCLSDDPDVAAKVKHKDHRFLIDTSHFSVGVYRCASCGQHFVSVFMELVDWEGGDDSMANVYVPLTAEEANGLPEFSTAGDAKIALRAMDLTRRKLWWVKPRGKTESRYWEEGELYFKPHD
jgi:hypothetical protein